MRAGSWPGAATRRREKVCRVAVPGQLPSQIFPNALVSQVGFPGRLPSCS